MDQFSFPRQPHFSKFTLISFALNTVVTFEKKFLKYITSNGLSSKLDVSILWLSKIGYLERIIGVLPIDEVEDFEPFNEEKSGIVHLSISDTLTLSYL